MNFNEPDFSLLDPNFELSPNPPSPAIIAALEEQYPTLPTAIHRVLACISNEGARQLTSAALDEARLKVNTEIGENVRDQVGGMLRYAEARGDLDMLAYNVIRQYLNKLYRRA